MVSRQVKLGLFIRNDEILQVVLLGKFIAKPQPVVEKAESDNHPAVVDGRLLKRDCQLFVMITNLFFLTPYRRPGFVYLGWFGFDDGEARGKGGTVFQFNPQPALLDDRFSNEGKRISRLTLATQ